MKLAELALIFLPSRHYIPHDDFVPEMLRSVGVIGEEKYKPLELYMKLCKHKEKSPERNDILFFGEMLEEITQIGIAINRWQYVSANSGQGLTVRPIKSRDDLIAVIRPEYNVFCINQ